jgi:hypothetical protein|tara:strand:- start:97 stop:378 length:282 start_codon:yes stop_codon:yes gene_type:complete
MNFFRKSNTGTAEILSYADSSHYLVSICKKLDSNGVFIKSKNNKIRKFSSLFEAEYFLHHKGFDKAVLRMQSAYDEIAGGVCEDSLLTIPLAH